MPDPLSPAWNFMAHNERVELSGLEHFQQWATTSPWALNGVFASKLADNARRNGVYSAFHDKHTKHVEIIGDNWRETIVAFGLSSRTRAVADELADAPVDARILMLEAVTPFALTLRARFPFALGVEYLPTDADRQRFFPVQHCDITNADFADASFDYVVSNDVLEHVPDLTAAMSETRRILKRGGICLATFPFAAGQNETVVKAHCTDNGTVIHLTTPEYHGNPVLPGEGSLVFSVPGWDILDLCRDVGFSNANMLFISSAQRAITGTESAGVFILRATV